MFNILFIEIFLFFQWFMQLLTPSRNHTEGAGFIGKEPEEGEYGKGEPERDGKVSRTDENDHEKNNRTHPSCL